MKSIAVSSDVRSGGALGQGLLAGASDPLASSSSAGFDFDEPARLAAEKAKASAKRARCQLIWAMVFCLFFMIAEVVGGYLAKSLAIMTDAAHLLSDVASFSISLFAVWLAERPPTAFATFGFHRIEIFGALASVLLIWVLTGVLCYEAVQRIITPEDVDGRTMFIVAVLGVIVNIIMMKILSSSGGGHGHAHGGEGGGAGEHGHSHDIVGLFKKMVKGSGKGKGKGLASIAASSSGHGHSHGAGEARHKPLLAMGTGTASSAGYGSLPDSEAASSLAIASASAAEGHGHSHGPAAAPASDAAGEAEHHGHSHGSGGGGEEENLNVRAAFIHALGDLVQSVGVVIAAIIIWAKPEARIADPICTFLFSILVLFTTFGVVKTGLRTLLNSTPAHINLRSLAHDLMAIPGVANVHDLHVFAYGANRVALTVHIVADEPAEALEAAQRVARQFGIQHSTVQVERCSSLDIQRCYEYNAHIGACKLTLEDTAAAAAAAGAAKGHGHAHSHAHSHGHGHAHGHGEEARDSHGHGHGHSHGRSSGSGAGLTVAVDAGPRAGAGAGTAADVCDGTVCAVPGAGGAAAMANSMPVPVVLDRPSPMSRHDGPGGCGAIIASTPTAAAAAAVPVAEDAHGHSHSHSHSHGHGHGHGHSH